MAAAIRRAAAADAAECGRIICEAFEAIADQHGFPRDFPSAEAATDLASMLIAHPGFYGVVAEQDGRILGSNFLDERSPIARVGPITVDPAAQNAGVGRRLMETVIKRAASRKLSRRPAGPGRLSQPLAQPLHEARLRDARAAVGHAGTAT
jgi:GNAT superfamily N-acetyltransferase